TPSEPVDSLSMEDEHLNTISATKLDEFIKSCVENLVPNPSESEGENEENLFEPSFDEEIIPIEIDQHSFNAESGLIDSMLNHDSSSKTDSFFDEFAGELTLLKSIPPGIDETDCHHEKETRFVKRLLYNNSSPRPPEAIVSDNSNADIESFSPSPIPVEDSDSQLLDNYSLSLSANESYHFDIPSPYRPPAKPPDGNTRTLNIKMIGDASDQKICMLLRSWTGLAESSGPMSDRKTCHHVTSDLLAPSCFNGRSRGLQRDIRAKKKGLQPQGVASVPENRSSSSNSVLGRKARKPKAMIYTCSLPEVDVEKRALMQGKERSGLTSLASLPVASASESNLERPGPTCLIGRCLPSRDSCVYGPKENHSNPSSGQHAILYDISWELKVAVPFPQASSSLNLKEEGDLLAPSCFNGRSRGLQRDIRAKKKGLQPQGVASVPDNRSSSSNSVLGRKARKPKAMIYTCSLPEVDVEKRALMQGKERGVHSHPGLLHSPKPQNRHLAEALGGEGVSLLVYPRLIGNGKPGECYQLPLLPRWKAYELD
nr:putative xyloglucan endotransglucosylase/hydrolase protein 25 [Tanacetum cinerariifolium]